MTNARTRRPHTASAAPFAIAAALAAITGCGETKPAEEPRGGAKATHELVGQPAPSFTEQMATQKGTVSVGEGSGKVQIVDFWATWCKPCQKSFPVFEDLRVKYGASGLEIVGVSEDDEPDDIRKFAESYGANFPLVWDKDKSIASKWHPTSMPTTFIVDKKGVVRFVHLGYHEGEGKEIEAEVKSLL